MKNISMKLLTIIFSCSISSVVYSSSLERKERATNVFCIILEKETSSRKDLFLTLLSKYYENSILDHDNHLTPSQVFNAILASDPVFAESLTEVDMKLLRLLSIIAHYTTAQEFIESEYLMESCLLCILNSRDKND